MFNSPDHTSDECGFCSTVVFDPNQTSDPVSGRQLKVKDSQYAFFLGPTLDSILAAESSCPLAKWLVTELKSKNRLKEKWNNVCKRGSTIKLCFTRQHDFFQRDSVGFFVLIGSLVDKAGQSIALSTAGYVYCFAQEGKVFYQPFSALRLSPASHP